MASKLLTILQSEFAVRQSYVLYYQSRIASGVYKTRKVHHGGFDGPLFTEQELLEDETRTMLRHIHLMSELIESMHDCTDA